MTPSAKCVYSTPVAPWRDSFAAAIRYLTAMSQKFKPGERIFYSPLLGVSEKTYYNWTRLAAAEHVIEHREGQGGGYFVPGNDGSGG
jgi:hypothetical protein